MIVLESNQNHAVVRDTEICTTLPASMGLGGGYVPMILTYTQIGFAEYKADDKVSLLRAKHEYGGVKH